MTTADAAIGWPIWLFVLTYMGLTLAVCESYMNDFKTQKEHIPELEMSSPAMPQLLNLWK